MATKHVHEIIAKTVGFGKAEKGVKNLSGSMKKFATGLVSAAAAYKAFSVGLESIQLAGKLEGVETAFNNMRKEAGFSINTFSKLDKALDGTADKITIMEQANNAMLLGIAESEEQMAEMFDVAQRLARAVGQDATFGIESLVTGLGRQSKLMLDNLGIMVDVEAANKTYAQSLNKTTSELTDQERKQAFINEAMRQGKTLVDGIGEETITASDKIQRFTTSITNLKIAVGEALIESGVLDQLDRFTQFLNNYTQEAENANNKQLAMNMRLKALQILIDDGEKAYLEYTKGMRFFNDEMIMQIEMLEGSGSPIERHKQLKQAIDESNASLNANTTSMSTNNEAMKEYVSVFTETPIISTMSEFSMLLTDQEMNALNLQDRIKKLMEAFEDLSDAKKEDIRTTKDQIRTGFSAAASHKTMAQAAVDAAKAEITASIQAAIANIIKANSTIFAPLGALAPPIIAGIAAGASTMFQQQISRIEIGSQTGFEGVVDEPTQFTVGEGGAAEYVSVTPLEGVNNAGGQGMTINISGNVMSDQFVTEELAEKIKEAVRLGVDFGMS